MNGKLAVLFYLVVASSALDYDDCGSTAIINSVTLDGCTAQPCTMITGQSYNLNVTGVTTTAVSSLPTVVGLDVLGISVPIVYENSCGYVQSLCSSLAPAPFAYTRVFNVTASLPVETVASAIIKDQGGNTVVCAKLAVDIINP